MLLRNSTQWHTIWWVLPKALTLCDLKDFSIEIYEIRIGLSIIYFKDHRSEFPNYDIFLSLQIILATAKSVDPDEMRLYVAFY